MKPRRITEDNINSFMHFLIIEEKSEETVEKYIRDVKRFRHFANNENITKELVSRFKTFLIENNYSPRTINAILAGINSFLCYMGWNNCKVKNIRWQKSVYCSEERELTKTEYYKLLNEAKKDRKILLIMETICGTGIRVSELKYFTVSAVKSGEIVVNCKNKVRKIFVPAKLRKNLLRYARDEKIKEGAIFKSKKGTPIDRKYIWRRMKKLSKKAGVIASKVFPHNLRKLFARMFYSIEKDISKLADVLGHSSINTTRIYIMTSGKEHRRQMEKLKLIL
ncbi:MAG: tyrosine-type recombinase/integrase [Oscillospiraceae bacterium]|nr:tyrosine-type recombinase/integrase [Oscillospiraceae bacterium]